MVVFFVFGLSLFGCAQTHPDIQEPVMGKVAYIPQKDTTKKCVKDTTHKAPIKGRVSTSKTKQPKKKKDPEPPKLMGEIMAEDKQK